MTSANLKRAEEIFKRCDPFERFQMRKKTLDGACIRWGPTAGANGYGTFWNGKRTIKAHRASWIFSRGEIPKGLYVLHKCDVRDCINIDHLWLGTCKDNTADMIKKGRAAYGEKHPKAKLTNIDVKNIRSLVGKIYQKDIALRFGVSATVIRRIAQRKIWRNV